MLPPFIEFFSGLPACAAGRRTHRAGRVNAPRPEISFRNQDMFGLRYRRVYCGHGRPFPVWFVVELRFLSHIEDQ
jgi:hypothetical protein